MVELGVGSTHPTLLSVNPHIPNTMPAIAPRSTVMVTGATGYIGAWTAHDLLERGFNVRAA